MPNCRATSSRATQSFAHASKLSLAVLVSVLSGLLALAPPVPVLAVEEQSSEGSGKTATDLARSAERAVGYAIKSARQSKDANLQTSNARSKQFWTAMQKLNVAIDKVERGLFLKDESFFTSLGDAASAVQEAKVALQVSGASDAAVSEGLDKADRAIVALRQNYSLEAKRRDSGKPLTTAEKAKLDEIKKKQAEVDAKLKEIETKVGKNQKQIEGIRAIRRHTRDIHHCGYDPGGFFGAIFAWSIIDGLIWGWGPWWGWDWGGDFIYIDVDIIDIGGGYDWDYVAEEIDLDTLDLEVAIDEAELEELDAFVADGDFELSEAEMDDIGMSDGAGDDDLEASVADETAAEEMAMEELDPGAIEEIDPEPFEAIEVEAVDPGGFEDLGGGLDEFEGDY